MEGAQEQPGASTVDVKAYLDRMGKLVNTYLEQRFKPLWPDVPPVLTESMRYSVLAGGKRLRPVLALASYEACGGNPADIIQCASALEAIHTYSLIHDDLPAMDNDDLRRGKPTNHKVYGEAIAILAGDGLLTEAFLMVLEAGDKIPMSNLLEAIRELAIASGPAGMVGGQVQDILSENSTPDPVTLQYIHEHKTGALLTASVKLGGILYGASAQQMQALTLYGSKMGLAFQIVDDILDLKGDEALLGKPVGSDLEKNKMTYPAVYGIDASMQKADQLIREAVAALAPLGPNAEPLRAIAWYIIQRTH